MSQRKRRVEAVVKNREQKFLSVGLSTLYYTVTPKLNVEGLLITATHGKVYG